MSILQWGSTLFSAPEDKVWEERKIYLEKVNKAKLVVVAVPGFPQKVYDDAEQKRKKLSPG